RVSARAGGDRRSCRRSARGDGPAHRRPAARALADASGRLGPRRRADRRERRQLATSASDLDQRSRQTALPENARRGEPAYLRPGTSSRPAPTTTAATPIQLGMETRSRSLTDSSRGPSLASWVSLVNVKPL